MEDIMTYCDEGGSVRLLPGYKFDPTDEVLVDFYLKRRVFSQPLPFQIIPDFNVFQTEPWSLPGGDEKIFNERKCFFYKTIGRGLEEKYMRVVGSGQWRVMEKGKDVPIPQNNEAIGKRNTLRFLKVQGACARKTKWVMHEFRLALVASPSKMTNWAVYRIFQNKDAKKMKNVRESIEESSNAIVMDFNVESGSFSQHSTTHSLSESSKSPCHVLFLGVISHN